MSMHVLCMCLHADACTHLEGAICWNHPSRQSMSGDYSGLLSAEEAAALLEGRLPHDEEDGLDDDDDGCVVIPVYSYGDFLTASGSASLPDRYAVVTEIDQAEASPRGYEAFDDLRDDPLFIVYAGGADAASAYVDKVAERQSSLGNWPPYWSATRVETELQVGSGLAERALAARRASNWWMSRGSRMFDSSYHVAWLRG